MEEEIICNRWKDLADGPKGRESGPSVMVFLSSGTNYFSLPILSSRILIRDHLSRHLIFIIKTYTKENPTAVALLFCWIRFRKLFLNEKYVSG